MVLYEVTLDVERRLGSALAEYMAQDHIPAIWATGCFQRIRFDQASPSRFRTCYQAESQADLDRYLRNHAPQMRAEFASHFPEGVTLAREIWTVQEIWC
jgi:Domain of unknown function (DUF4286)